MKRTNSLISSNSKLKFRFVTVLLICILGVQVFGTLVSSAGASDLTGPRVRPSNSVLDQGQNLTLTSTQITTGTPPYLYQWFNKAPDAASFSIINDATSSNYNFTTTSSTETGSWSFILQVTDSTGVSVNSTAVSVVVNSALTAPPVSANLWTIIQGETSILSATATTGTGDYVFNWWVKVPDGNYNNVQAIGSVAWAGYYFKTTSHTTTGNWSFYLQVTDSVGETAYSNPVTVLVISPPPTPSPVPSPLPGQLLDNVWFEKASMQVGRSGLGVATVDGKIYAIGGSTYQYIMAPPFPYAPVETHGTGGVVGTNEQYNPSTDTWVTKAQMPISREYFAIAVYQNMIYCIGGSTGNVTLAINEVYNVTSDSWITKAPMPTPEERIQANVVNGKIYVLGGSSNYVYDPLSDNWTSMSPTPIKTGYTTSAVLDDKIFVIGTDATEIYDPLNDSWSTGAPYPQMLDGNATSVATSGFDSPKQIYVFNEIFSENWSEGLHTKSLIAHTKVEAYSLENNSWTFGVDLPSNRYSFGVAVLNDSFFVVGGCNVILLSPASWVPGSLNVVGTNEQYLPVGYGTPDPSYMLETMPSTTPLNPFAGASVPFPIVTVAAVSTAVAFACVGVILYLRKRLKTV